VKVEKLKIRVGKSNNTGIFHDSRSDVAKLGEVCNKLINKVNELVDEVNTLKEGKSHD